VTGEDEIEVTSPWSGEVVDTVPAMLAEREAARVESWIGEAVGGADATAPPPADATAPFTPPSPTPTNRCAASARSRRGRLDEHAAAVVAVRDATRRARQARARHRVH